MNFYKMGRKNQQKFTSEPDLMSQVITFVFGKTTSGIKKSSNEKRPGIESLSKRTDIIISDIFQTYLKRTHVCNGVVEVSSDLLLERKMCRL